jgi:type I restriction enzyme M protein
MLNFDIKRKINTLRDILVGKVPDPKAQVEQITIALIYKFMDDMDIEGMEFGGSREFFKEDYEKYAWSNIMQPENSGQQRANLYAEGIDKMSMNPHLPQLFRDIFRGAYVPYRDAETLNMFLKEINDFTYDHSEELGNAFEYLLSIMGSQGDAGQFRTPRHIIDMMVEIVDPQKTDSILDPACGTAGFLISSYKHILEKNKDNDGNSTLSADDRKRMTENFAGYDISPDMVRLSRVNMYLHKFAKPQISEYDTLSSLDKWDETYDVILANPPFMTPKGGIIPHNRYRIPAKRAEVLFVDYIAEHLNPTGKAAVIVPEGIVFQSANAYKSLRKYLIEDDLLYAVISLPAGVFNPYSGVKTSILLMDKTLAKQKDEILFVKINNDGYDLGAQRREVNGSDIPEVKRIIKDYQNGIDVSENALVTIASKKDIAEQEYILVGERFKEAVVLNSDYPMVELGEICEVERGTSITKNDIIDGNIPVIAGGQQPAYFHNVPNRTGKVITVSGSGAYAGFINYFEEPIFASDCSTIQSSNPNVNLTYIYHTIKAQQDRFYKLQSGMGQPHVYAKDIRQFKVPLPPLHIQQEIVKEIEGYQKIIDGAKQVVENYKPTIKIDQSWEMVKLGDICIYDRQMVRADDETLVYIGMEDIESNSGIISKSVNDRTNNIGTAGAYLFNENHILYGRLRPYLNKVATPNFSGKCSTELIPILVNKGMDKNFLSIILRSDDSVKFAMSTNTGARMPRTDMNAFKNYIVPLPPMEVQQQIMSQINEEIAIIENNKHLIEMFQRKIKDMISEVWG